MNCPLCERVEKTKKSEYPFLIHEYKNSYLYLGEHQFYKGYSVLVSKYHYREMTDMPENIRNELFLEMMDAHKAIQKSFSFKKMNMCSLGNVVDHIHWHFFPRYEEDPNFKNPPWLQMHQFDSVKPNEQERNSLIKEISSHCSRM